MSKRSNEQWQALINAQATSSLSPTAFCKQQGICYKRFAINQRRLQGKPAKPAFISVKPPATPPSQAQMTVGHVTLILPLSPLEPTLALINALS